MTVKAGRNASIGNYTITIKATGGGKTQTTAITLNVTR
jgi:hypothetical protein